MNAVLGFQLLTSLDSFRPALDTCLDGKKIILQNEKLLCTRTKDGQVSYVVLNERSWQVERKLSIYRVEWLSAVSDTIDKAFKHRAY